MKRYFGWSLVVVATGLVTALVTGNSLAAAVIAIAITLMLIAAVVGRNDSLSDSSNREGGSLSEPYSAIYRWQVNRQPDFDDICNALDQAGLGLKPESMTSGKLVLKGGSQLHSRLWGGYFVDPKRLPIRAELKTMADPDGARCDVELDIKDDFHIAIRDAALRNRLAQAAESIREVVETRLRTMEHSKQGPT